MKLKVRLFAGLRERAARADLELDGLPEPLDVAGLKHELERRWPQLGPLSSVRAVVGTRYVDEFAPLADGSEVALLPPVSGGAGDLPTDLELGRFELSREPLSVEAARSRVARTACGAIVTFAGTARDHSRGRSVLHLEYEAFEAMTVPEMERIFARCRAELERRELWRAGEALAMLCQHRVGRVELGQAAVVIAVASAHRATAFEACRFLIEELKQSLPIWKKEFYPGGESWIGERS